MKPYLSPQWQSQWQCANLQAVSQISGYWLATGEAAIGFIIFVIAHIKQVKKLNNKKSC